MQLQLQLYIEGQQVELHDNESVVLNQSLQNVRDIKKIFTDFTQTFNVPASKVNNKIFKHFYNFDIQGFDARNKKVSELHLNYERFKKGKVKLEGVQMANNEPVNYRLTFFGETVALTDLLGDDKLDNLTLLNDFETQYDADTIIDLMGTPKDITAAGETYEDALVVPLITHTQRLYYDSTEDIADSGNLHVGSNTKGVEFEQLKPALRVYAIIKAIERQYGITFSTDFFNKTNAPFYGLYMWLHRKKGGVFDEGQNQQEPMFTFGGFSNTDNGKELLPSLQRLGIKNRIYGGSGTRREIKCTIYTGELTSPTQPTYSFIIKKNGEEWFRQDNVTSDSFGNTTFINFDTDYGLESGEDFYSFYLVTEDADKFTLTVDLKETIRRLGFSSTRLASATSHTIQTTADIDIYAGTQTPKIKVIDFLTGLFKMFNLTAFKEDDVIVVKTLDSFYESSTTTHNITEHIDKTSSEVNAIMPYSQIELKYKDTEAALANKHKEFTNLEWGTAHFNNKSIYEGGSYTIEVPFGHHKFERLLDAGNNNAQTAIQWGWSADADNNSHLGEPLLFYVHKIIGSAYDSEENTISVKKSPTVSQLVTTFHIPSNAVDPTTSSQTINFSAELNEYTNTVFTNSLFDTYYKTYIVDTFNINRRLSKFKAYLPLGIIKNLKLQDKVVIFNNLYKINTLVTNFETGLSELELINEVSDFRILSNESDLARTIDSSVVTADSIEVKADTEELTI